ncbi:cation:proton antiporter [Tessaracoccus sp. OS52]|uniref:cation:proton antiporter n=1 Tax=Tessaracoccus sp. OS52 TaxID=2886691 RepID=UPI001D1278D1|nr:cation:proton antiporter [Tessaracoccus sp. OS52]
MEHIWLSLTQALATLDPAGYLAIVAVVAAVCQWLAWQLRVPSILLLLVVGFGLGQLVGPDAILGRDVLFGGVTLAVGIILFEGSMSLRLRDARDLGRPLLRLFTITVVIAWALITAAAWLLGFQLEIALLVGAILVVTGPTVIAPILRTLRPTRRVGALLKWEGIVVDPIGAILAVLVFQGVLAGRGGDALPQLVGSLALTVAVASVLGLGLGFALEQLVKRHLIPDFLHGVVFLSVAIGALAASNAIQPESGLLTVTVLGIYLGNRPGLHLRHVQEFTEHLQVLLVGGLFLILAGRIAPAEVLAVAPEGLLFVALLVVVVRPVSILLGLWGTNVSREERGLLAFMAPRGIVAAAVASIFGLEFLHAAERAVEEAVLASGEEAERLRERATNLAVLSEQAADVVPLVFLVIVCTVAIYGLGVGRLAERLGLATTSPQGVLFVGGARWIVEMAKTLDEADVTTTIVDREYARLSAARRAGLKSVTANILSDYAVKDMELAGIRTLIAATPDDEVNATAAREFAHVLGRANVFQLQRPEEKSSLGGARTKAASHLNARICFQPARTHEELEDLMDRGFVVKRTKLTPEFTLADFHSRWGDDVVLLFTLEDGQVQVVTAESKLKGDGITLVALVPGQATGHS